MTVLPGRIIACRHYESIKIYYKDKLLNDNSFLVGDTHDAARLLDFGSQFLGVSKSTSVAWRPRLMLSPVCPSAAETSIFETRGMAYPCRRRLGGPGATFDETIRRGGFSTC